MLETESFTLQIELNSWHRDYPCLGLGQNNWPLVDLLSWMNGRRSSPNLPSAVAANQLLPFVPNVGKIWDVVRES